MLTSNLGGKPGVKQLLDILSNPAEIKKSITSLIDKEASVQKKLDELYHGVSAKKYHDNLKNQNDKAVKLSKEIAEHASELAKSANARVREQEEQYDEQLLQLDLRKELLNKRESELSKRESMLNDLSYDLDVKAGQVEKDAAEVVAMQNEYETKLADIKKKFESLSS